MWLQILICSGMLRGIRGWQRTFRRNLNMVLLHSQCLNSTRRNWAFKLQVHWVLRRYHSAAIWKGWLPLHNFHGPAPGSLSTALALNRSPMNWTSYLACCLFPSFSFIVMPPTWDFWTGWAVWLIGVMSRDLSLVSPALLPNLLLLAAYRFCFQNSCFKSSMILKEISKPSGILGKGARFRHT